MGTGAQQKVSLHYVPATSFLVFDAAPNADGVGRRLRELSAALAAAPATAALALTDCEAGSLDAMLGR